MSATATLTSRSTFIPRADTQVLWPNQKPPPRPVNLPLLRGDLDNAERPIEPWNEAYLRNLPKGTETCAASPVPEEPEDPTAAYLFPVLANNERLRLTLLWYYTRDFDADQALLFRLQEKVRLVQEIIGWDMVITGILDNEKYTSLATVGLPLATYPRRESACAHTINNRGNTLVVPDTQLDWRFKQAPHFKPGGLRAYAGFPLHVETDFGEKISLGSLCVVSTSPQEPLSATQHAALVGFADMIAAEIVHASKLRRQRERHQMLERVAKLQEKLQEIDAEALIMAAIQERYPQAIVSVQSSESGVIAIAERDPISFHDIVGGVWEDTEYLESQILNNNHQQFSSSRTVRVLASRCAHFSTPTFLVVASSEIQYVFDDVDAWFIERCASALSTVQQERNLQKALKAKELFLRGMTHQLRTPIHGVLGAVELLAEELGSLRPSDHAISPIEPASNFNASPFIRTIRTSGRDLMSIVDSMLKLNRLDDITHKPAITTLSNLKDMETDIMNDILQTTPEDSLQHVSVFFHNKLPPECATLTIDLHLLKDCLQHLVMNAIQNTASGNVNITIHTPDDKRSLLIDVEDNGKGISPQDQIRIFDAFEKIDVHSKGVGLGLTLAARLAKVMSGSLILKSSEIDKGSHFQMEFRSPDFAPIAVPEQPLREQLIHLPLSFCVVPAPTTNHSVGARFGNYLEGHGFEKVDCGSAPLTIIDCSMSDSHLTDVVFGIDAAHVAIYLVPVGTNTEELAFLTNKRNIISLPGPFTSTNIFQTLRNADAIYSLYTQNQNTTAVIDHSTDIPSSLAITTAALKHNSHLTHCVSHSPLYPTIKLEPTIQILPTASPSLHSIDLPPPPPSEPFALLVDDNAINLQIMTMYCKKRKIPYITAADGAEAVKRFLDPTFRAPHAGKRVNLVLMDLQMPVRDGILATSDIRNLERENGWRRAAVLMVTGQDSPSDRVRAAEAGADAFLVKPVAMRTLDQGIKGFFPDFLGA